jgi:hypothetical protein
LDLSFKNVHLDLLEGRDCSIFNNSCSKFYEKGLCNKVLIVLILGLSLFIIALGTITQLSFGKFIYTSSTGPLNLLIGANDNATGAYNYKVFEKGKQGYIQNSDSMTYIEKGKLWEQKTSEWVISHPLKWLSLIPARIFFMFAWDDFTIPYTDGMFLNFLWQYSRVKLFRC